MSATVSYISPNEWLSSNFDWIRSIANVYTREPVTLIGYFYEWLIVETNYHRLLKMPPNEQTKFMGAWFRNQSKWTTPFTRDTNEILANDIDIEHLCEETPYSESPQNLEEELTQLYGEVFNQRYVKLRWIFIYKLSPTERILYELYYVDGLPMRVVSKKVKIPLTTVYCLIRDLREKIERLIK